MIDFKKPNVHGECSGNTKCLNITMSRRNAIDEISFIWLIISKHSIATYASINHRIACGRIKLWTNVSKIHGVFFGQKIRFRHDSNMWSLGAISNALLKRVVLNYLEWVVICWLLLLYAKRILLLQIWSDLKGKKICHYSIHVYMYVCTVHS